MRTIIIVLLFSKSLLLHAQNICLLDSESNEPIPFANIIYSSNDVFVNGLYSDENGCFNSLNPNYDRLKISCIGYIPISINKVDLKEKKVYLKRQVVELEEVVVSKKFNDSLITIGYTDKKKSSDKVGVSIGLEVAVYIKNDLDLPVKLNSFLFRVKKVKSKTPYRLHIYKPSKNNAYPNEDLLTENVINYIEPDTQGLIEIDLSKYNIELPKEGIYVGIEGLVGLNYKENISTTKTNVLQFEVHKSELQIYQERNILNGVGWININKWLPENFFQTFNKKYNLKNLFVPSFGLTVKKTD